MEARGWYDVFWSLSPTLSSPPWFSLLGISAAALTPTAYLMRKPAQVPSLNTHMLCLTRQCQTKR